jgi:site-specific recombinase XerD
MTTIREHAEQYLAMRRALGFKLTTFGYRLFDFVAYLEAHHADVITTDAAVAWATSTPHSSDEVTWSRRLMTARIFARHLAVLDPSTEIPPADVLPHHYRRVTPHLFATEEVAALLRAADGLRPPLRALTWRTLMGLLAVTGLRTGEACRLDDVDVDLGDALTVTIRDSKFGKHRLVPIHASTAAAVRNYQRARDRALPTVRTPALLVTTRGTRLDANICRTFRRPRRIRGHHRPGRAATPAAGGLPPHLRHHDLAGLVPGRRRRSRTHGPAEHLPRACRSEIDVLVFDRQPGTARHRRLPARPCLRRRP